jgi:DNA-binding NarL/FixJ family response regulator
MEKDFSSDKKASNPNSIPQKMPKKHKIIQKMVDMGLSIGQIADVLDSNEKTIQDLLRYARSKEKSSVMKNLQKNSKK